MYPISDYSIKQAKKLHVNIKPSNRKNKKIDVYVNNKYVVSIGDNRYNDYPTYIKSIGKKEADKHRYRYKKRHEKDRHVKNSAGWFADRILW
jgi:hypothetical protein